MVTCKKIFFVNKRFFLNFIKCNATPALHFQVKMYSIRYKENRFCYQNVNLLINFDSHNRVLDSV